MGKFSTRRLLVLTVLFAVGMLICPLHSWSEAPTMTKDELKAHLGVKDFVIIDVRTESDWKTSEYKIKSASREEPDFAKKWASKYSKDKAIVLYCA